MWKENKWGFLLKTFETYFKFKIQNWVAEQMICCCEERVLGTKECSWEPKNALMTQKMDDCKCERSTSQPKTGERDTESNF